MASRQALSGRVTGLETSACSGVVGLLYGTGTCEVRNAYVGPMACDGPEGTRITQADVSSQANSRRGGAASRHRGRGFRVADLLSK